MKKIVAILLLSVIFFGCDPQTPPIPVEEQPDSEQQVYFTIPENWIEDSNYYPNQPSNIVVYHDQSVTVEQFAETTVLIKQEIDNSENLTVQQYTDRKYEECTASNPPPPENADILRIPCIKDDVANWNQITINGITAYRSEIRGVPESGESEEIMYIPLNNKIIKLNAGYRGYSNEELARQHALIDGIYDSVEVR